MRSALTVSAAGHVALVALLLAWPLLLPHPRPDTPPQVEVLTGGGATPAPPSPPPAPIVQPQKPSAESEPAKAPQPTPSDQPTPPQSAAAPALPSPTPPPDPAKTPVADGDAGPMGDLRDPAHKLLRPATADTGNQPPVYPSESVRLHEQGQVTLRLHINPQGQVAQAEIAVSSGSAELDKAALAAISAWHFHPALQDGKPVPDIIEMGIDFRIP